MSVSTYLPTNVDSSMNVVSTIGAAFSVHEQDTPDMTVRVEAGQLLDEDGSVLQIAAQNSPSITAPTSNPRNDILYLDPTDGTVGIETGTEAASPTDPTIPAGTLPLARLRLTISITVIVNIDIDDCRVFPPPGDFFRRLKTEEKTGNGTVGRRDAGKMWIANSSSALTFNLGQISSLKKGFVLWVKNIGTGTLTISPHSGQNIDGVTSITVDKDESTMIWNDGTEWFSLGNVGDSGGSSGSGKVLQVVFEESGGGTASTTGTMSYNNTVPGSSDGGEFLTKSITVQEAGSKLLVETQLCLSSSASPMTVMMAVFKDNDSSALVSTSFYQTQNTVTPMAIQYLYYDDMDPLSANDTVEFKVRAGGTSASTTHLNTSGGTPYLGGSYNTYLKITEIAG